MNDSTNHPLLAVLASMGPIWAIDPLAARATLEMLRFIDMAAHQQHFRDGRVLVVETGEHVNLGDIPQIRGAADWYGVHSGKQVKNDDGSRKAYPMDGGVALLAIEGPTSKEDSSLSAGTSTVRARKTVRTAKNDPDVKSALMRFDTPGGTVAGCDDFAAEIRAFAASGKPIYAYCEDLCASAGYYAASQCTAIYANKSARIGSINTYMTVYDVSKLFSDAGIATHNVAGDDAPYKGLGTPGTPLTPDQKTYLQSLVNNYSNQFKAAVKSGRGLSDEQMAQVCDGRTFPANQARSLGLIDGVTSYDSVLAKLKTWKSGMNTPGAGATGK